jgi:hypothetical protein
VARIVSLHVGDPPERWQGLGFTVVGGTCRVGEVLLVLDGARRGVVSWILEGAGSLAELPSTPGSTDRPAAPAPTAHPNGVTSLDHLVVTTPDPARTVAAVEAAGIGLRRRRETGPAEDPRIQAFFRLGATILEVVGPAATTGPGPARFWGLAFTVADLDATASFLGPRLQPAIDAVQPGRRIATLDASAGSTVPMAFLTADPGRAGATSPSPGAAGG